MAKSKDLFDETTMTFGEHLDALRTHLIKAIIGLVLALIMTLTWGNRLVDLIRTPIDQALKRNAMFSEDNVSGGIDFWGYVGSWFGRGQPPSPPAEAEKTPESAPRDTILVRIKPSDLSRVLHDADPEHYSSVHPADDEKAIAVPMTAPEFKEFRQTTDEMHRPVTLNVQEAFMMYIKVAFISGLIIASPWILYQLWLFIAAGLYPHERRYVHVYLPMSIGLFLVGAAFAFYLALPLVLDFLLSYNRWLGVVPQIRLSEWVSFVILLPLMFGVSFELPLAMLFLERINIFRVDDYRSRRRLSIFVIAVLAMLLSPGGDPGTMMLMFVPLVILYEFGIILCGMRPARPPLETAAS